jgi:glutathione-regulated potassium-efflux system ancillary protein KefG
MDELLRPFEATAHLCGCIWRTPFVLHDSRQLDPAALMAAGDAFRARIEESGHG